MKGRAYALVLLSVCQVFVLSGCRSRRVKPPQVAPPSSSAAAAGETVPVPARDREFVQSPASDGETLPADAVEATRIARERGLIRDAFFAFDASTLDADAQTALQRSAGWLRDNPAYSLRIEGHCDERGTEQYNLALGDRRAETASTYLQSLGVDSSRITTVSYGEERPFEEGSGEPVWSQNRRAHLVLSGRR